MSIWPFGPPRDTEGWVGAYAGTMLFVLFGILAVMLVVWALISAIRNPFLADVPKVLWVLAILLLPVVGALLYAWLRPRTFEAPMPRV
jgi:hypothetical protein